MILLPMLAVLMGPAFLASLPVSGYGVWRGRAGWALAGAVLSAPLCFLYLSKTPRLELWGLLPVACHLLAAAAVHFRLRWAGALALAPILLGFAYFAWEVSGEGTGPLPPAPTVLVGGRHVTLHDPNHCEGGGCAYGLAPPRLVLARALEPELVPAGAQVTIGFERRPLFFSVRRWEGGRPAELDLKRSGSFHVPSAPGVYLYDVSARWRQGGAFWVFYVWVEP